MNRPEAAMGGLAAADLLALAEGGPGLHPIDRALAILGRALPERSFESLAALPLGERDALLLEARAAALGDRIEAWDTCLACGERVEFDLSCAALAAAAGGGADAGHGEWPLVAGRFRIRLRPLDSRDVAAAAMTGEAAAARRVLLERAVVAAEAGGVAVPAGELPEAVVAAVAASLAEHDPGAEILVGLSCPACGESRDALFDVASFVAAELVAAADRVLIEVDVLARAYGWNEPEVLALSGPRRAAYVELAAG